jgi:hypothetical protein
VLPDGHRGRVEAARDPREVFAQWLLAPDNRWFARATVNRLWSWMMGRGIVHEPDDLRPDNPPSHPKLLDYLEREFVASGFDRDKLLSTIANSRTYQRSSIARTASAEADGLFAHYVVRRLEAEVLIDALCAITGTEETYSSPIPEPFTFLPDGQRAVSLGDGSIASPFLELFGHPPRDTGLESERSNGSSDSQRLHLLNSTHLQDKIHKGVRLRKLWAQSKGRPDVMATELYLAILSRPPTAAEAATARASWQYGVGKNARVAFDDLAWTLLNTKEFLHKH